MTDKQKHTERHKKLHQSLDELLADFILHTGRLPSKTILMEFMEWSYLQSLNPTPTPEDLEGE